MKIALLMENSQAGKNPDVLNEPNTVAKPLGHKVFNVGMSETDHHLNCALKKRPHDYWG